MRTLKVHQLYYEPETLYKKAKTKSQQALLGYMAKAGHLRDPIYGGAFNLLRQIEGYAGLYILESEERPKVAMEIIHITESAMLGMWDDFAFTEREINNISRQFGNFQLKGDK